MRKDAPGSAVGSIVDALKKRFPQLTPRLREAARYVIDNPESVALHSMREIASRAGVQHNVMQRLARDMGFGGYDEFRDQFRDIIVDGWQGNWLTRVETIHASRPDGPNGPAVAEFVNREIHNLQQTFSEETVHALDQAVAHITAAPRVYILGLRSLFPVSYYFHYVYRMFSEKSVLLTGLGGTFADDLRNVRRGDVLLALSYFPYAADTARAVELAHSRGAQIVAITDSQVSPILRPNSVNIIVSNASASLFPTPLPVFSVVQMLATLLVTHGNSDETLAAVRRSQEQLDALGVYLD